jgi:hypothetical protein
MSKILLDVEAYFLNKYPGTDPRTDFDIFINGMFHLLAIANGKKITVDIGRPDEVFPVEVVMLKDLEAVFDEEEEDEKK